MGGNAVACSLHIFIMINGQVRNLMGKLPCRMVFCIICIVGVVCIQKHTAVVTCRHFMLAVS